MMSVMQAGGFLMWVILLCSMAALAVIIERTLTLRPSKVIPNALTEKVDQLVAAPSANNIMRLSEHSPLGSDLCSCFTLSSTEPHGFT